MNTKICHKCLIEKPISDFRENRNNCIACERLYKREYQAKRRKENPEEIKKVKRDSYFRNKDEILKRKKETYNKNKPKFLERVAEYRRKNREKINAWFREYYRSSNAVRVQKDKKYQEKNRDKISRRMKEYRETHRAEVRQRNRSRKIALKFSNTDYTQKDWDYCLHYWNDSCAICGRKECEEVIIAADHWIPLKRGGLTHKKNILPLCHGINGCNNQKSSKDPVQWLYSKLGNSADTKLYQIETYFSHL